MFQTTLKLPHRLLSAAAVLEDKKDKKDNKLIIDIGV